METVVIIGAGPAGITAACELSKYKDRYKVIVLEEDTIGGISKTVDYNGNRMDMGGHRFFSKSERVNEWWEEIMPLQGLPLSVEAPLSRNMKYKEGGPDPDRTGRVMLIRQRTSRILFDGKFYDYPISLKPETFANMGIGTTAVAGCSYLKARLFPRKEKSLEDFYINRFGKKLYSMFFEHYTENLWGRHPSEIDPSWGAQRVKGISVSSVLKNAAQDLFHIKKKDEEASLIEEFKYPKLGPGEMWWEASRRSGADIRWAKALKVKTENGKVTGVVFRYTKSGDKTEHFLPCDYVISSMPVKDLVAGMDGVPENISRIAEGLPYRDYITCGVLIDAKQVIKRGSALYNRTKIRTLSGVIPDDWIYVHDRSVQMGRIQIYNNWSPAMVKNPQNTIWLGLEYFCNENDGLWCMSDGDFERFAVGELVKLGFIADACDALDCHVERVKKAYPAYFDTYSEFGEVRKYLDSFPNLFCVGRNGQHRYNNMDHSMMTAFEAVDDIVNGEIEDHSNVWNVNTEKEYHESIGKKS